jgi:hypothetical protein
MVDIIVQDEGFIHILYPLSHEARQWLDENVSDATQWRGGFVCGHRYIGPVVDGALRDGFVVETEC